MNIPEDLKYSRDHEWLEQKENVFRVGVSAYAVEQLGDIVHVELPEVGENFNKGDAFATIESTKTVSDVYIPLDAQVVAINEEVINSPELLQDDCYDKGWLIKFKTTNEAGNTDLLSEQQYKEFISTES